MGNKISCCTCHSPVCERKLEDNYFETCGNSYQDESLSYLQHISEREPEGMLFLPILKENFSCNTYFLLFNLDKVLLLCGLNFKTK